MIRVLKCRLRANDGKIRSFAYPRREFSQIVKCPKSGSGKNDLYLANSVVLVLPLAVRLAASLTMPLTIFISGVLPKALFIALTNPGYGICYDNGYIIGKRISIGICYGIV